jgi:NAD+ synthetase
MSAGGEVCFRAPAFDEGLFAVELQGTASGVKPQAGTCVEQLQTEASVYKALVTGTRDYITKHGFPGVILGLSGGIDSALVAAIACDAIGPDRVRAVMMPFRYTSNMSQEDAAKQAAMLGIRYDTISIETIYEATIAQLLPVLGEREPDATEENIQARCRGLLLMAISNKTGRMLLTTGNKSEMAVGYATLYGDMAGGFAPIKDCSKTLVFRLARYPCRITAFLTRFWRPSSKKICRWRKYLRAASIVTRSFVHWKWSSAMNTSVARRPRECASAAERSDAIGDIRSHPATNFRAEFSLRSGSSFAVLFVHPPQDRSCQGSCMPRP